ncbi:MAG: ankyrin repeat domain-containing protein [bacterium]
MKKMFVLFFFLTFSLFINCNCMEDDEEILMFQEGHNLTEQELLKIKRQFDCIPGSSFILNGNSPFLLGYLWLYPSVVKTNNQLGNTLLHMAAFFGEVYCAYLCLYWNADINSQNCFKQTPLHLAVLTKDFDMIKFLLEKRAKFDIQDTSGKTAKDLANDSNNQKISQLFKRYE